MRLVRLLRSNVITSLIASSACLFDLGLTLEGKAPCYGYGSIMGTPSKILEDDFEQVEALKVGQGNVYVSHINYLFEGKNNIQLVYKKQDDEDFRQASHLHGAKSHANEKRYTLRNPKSRILSPGMVRNDTKEQLLGFLFVEYIDYSTGDVEVPVVADPWALASFEPVNSPYYDYVETVGETLKQSEVFSWQVSS